MDIKQYLNKYHTIERLFISVVMLVCVYVVASAYLPNHLPFSLDCLDSKPSNTVP